MDELATLYHAHHSLHPDDLAFWQDMASEQGGLILELGCGTGRVLLPLVKAGWQVVGLDLQAGMLQHLRALAGQALSPPAHVFQANMLNFHLNRRFALIIIPCNTYSTLDSLQRCKVLEAVRRHLAQDGLLAISMPNPVLLRRLAKHSSAQIEESFPHPNDGEPVQVSSSWERTARQFIISWHYDHLLPDGRVQRTTAQAAHWLASMDEYCSELSQIGYRNLRLYGDFDRSPYAADSPALILVAGTTDF